MLLIQEEDGRFRPSAKCLDEWRYYLDCDTVDLGIQYNNEFLLSHFGTVIIDVGTHYEALTPDWRVQ